MEAPSVKEEPQVRITRARSTCQQDDASQSAEIMGSPVQIPEDIFHWIHALMPMRDAAQTACVSRGFLRSWRCYPKLFLSVDSLCIREGPSKKEDITMNFISRVDHIMQNHSGMGVKEFRLKSYPCSSLHPSYLDRWLQVAITPGIKDFELLLFDFGGTKYNFPGSFLSSQRGGSIQSFVLDACSFHSAPQVGCMSSLTNLDFRSVDITGEELYCFLTNSYALEKIVLWDCKPITILKIPCQLQRLNILQVLGCRNLEIIESNAPNLSIFFYDGRQIHVSLGNALQVRKIEFCHDYSPDTLYYARTKLPFIAPNLQTLVLLTNDETVNTPMVFCEFLKLKYLEIKIFSPEFSQDYDFCSLVSFIDASPVLETFILRIWMPTIRHDSIVENSGGDSLHSRYISECCHDSLKNVMITGFCSARSMIEFTIHIIENAKSLECLTLDTTRGHDRRFFNIDKCRPLNDDGFVEAKRSCVAIRRYVEGRVPSSVNLKVIEPCSKCIPDKL